MHPLYHHARQYVGRPVYVHHMNGRVYHGTLLNAAPHGIYVMEHPPGTTLSRAEQDSVDAELVYAPGRYFAFGALTGLTLGAMAGGLWW